MGEQLWKACKDGKVGEVQKLLQNEQINTNWINISEYSITFLYCLL